MAWFWTIIQLLNRLSASFSSCDIKMLHWIWYKIGGLNQGISYWKSYRITFRVVFWLVFKQLSSYLFVYWLLFVFTAEKYYLEFESKLKDWIKRYLIETWHRLFQGCFKPYRIASRVALWLDFGQLSSYLFVYRRLFSSYDIKMLHWIWYKLEDWIIRYLIETWHRSFQVYLKSYRIAFRVALWLDFGQLSSYLFVYRPLFWVTISKCNMEFDTNWSIE